jgi:small-conductance mechanosensitive channel
VTNDPVVAALVAWFTDPLRIGVLVRAVVYVVAGILLARAARYAVGRTATTLSAQQRQLLVRLAYYGILTLFFVSALRQFGFDFAVLLGAAGIVTLAIGFASQTSASNLISGLFLVLERVVQVGDVLTVDDVTGEVLSVDLLSTKIRTFDNLLVRIPNETMVKARITTLNRFPIRRVDLQVGVAYHSDLAAVQRTLFEVAHANPICLDEPAPLLIAQGFGDSSIDYQLSVWAKTDQFLALRNSITREVKEAFDAAGIEIPFPQRVVHGGASPLEVRVPASPPRGDPGEPEDREPGDGEPGDREPGDREPGDRKPEERAPEGRSSEASERVGPGGRAGDGGEREAGDAPSDRGGSAGASP